MGGTYTIGAADVGALIDNHGKITAVGYQKRPVSHEQPVFDPPGLPKAGYFCPIDKPDVDRHVNFLTSTFIPMRLTRRKLTARTICSRCPRAFHSSLCMCSPAHEVRLSALRLSRMHHTLQSQTWCEVGSEMLVLKLNPHRRQSVRKGSRTPKVPVPQGNLPKRQSI